MLDVLAFQKKKKTERYFAEAEAERAVEAAAPAEEKEEYDSKEEL